MRMAHHWRLHHRGLHLRHLRHLRHHGLLHHWLLHHGLSHHRSGHRLSREWLAGSSELRVERRSIHLRSCHRLRNLSLRLSLTEPVCVRIIIIVGNLLSYLLLRGLVMVNWNCRLLDLLPLGYFGLRLSELNSHLEMASVLLLISVELIVVSFVRPGNELGYLNLAITDVVTLVVESESDPLPLFAKLDSMVDRLEVRPLGVLAPTVGFVALDFLILVLNNVVRTHV
mmetsp:Transcript_34979/g.53694  ORF Transcript_34979/g.53694 Transcript_34979/m.53694 type:complete len:227 (+) Transcript_34979:205-885(+)